MGLIKVTVRCQNWNSRDFTGIDEFLRKSRDIVSDTREPGMFCMQRCQLERDHKSRQETKPDYDRVYVKIIYLIFMRRLQISPPFGMRESTAVNHLLCEIQSSEVSPHFRLIFVVWETFSFSVKGRINESFLMRWLCSGVLISTRNKANYQRTPSKRPCSRIQKRMRILKAEFSSIKVANKRS